MQNLSRSEEETADLASKLAGSLRTGDVLCLSGDLGAGKSVFARALIREISGNHDLDVPSPTFTLVQTYSSDICELWHFDLYRIKDSEEIYELGWEDAISEGISIIEWPEKLEFLAPDDRLDIVFSLSGDSDNDSMRIITLQPQGNWKDRKSLL
jgi:tRNA threonylcarbamoyladenosine biosynthesis protein TsaE